VRWAQPVGDYDGRDRTLQVFNADPGDQRRIREEIDVFRDELERSAGGPLVIIFHSVRQSAERYRELVRAFPKPI